MLKTYIILVNYNNHADTLKCLKSIAEAGYERSVIVVDNNSTVTGIDEIIIKFPSTILIKNQENIGFGRANNIGIKFAVENTNCKYIFILNNDTLIQRSTVDILKKEVEANTEIVMSTPRIVIAETPAKLWYGGGEIDWKRGGARTPGCYGPADAPLALKRRYVTFASGCAMFFKRSFLEKIKGFDERFFMYCEDVELCLRLVKMEKKIIYTPTALIQHSCQGSQRISTKKLYPMLHPLNPNLNYYLYHNTKNRLLLLSMHSGGYDKLKFFSYFPLSMFWKIINYAAYGKLSAISSLITAIKDYKQES